MNIPTLLLVDLDVVISEAEGVKKPDPSRGRDWPDGLEPPSLSGTTAADVINAIVMPRQTRGVRRFWVGSYVIPMEAAY